MTNTPRSPEFLPSERRMLQLLVMLPAPHLVQGDDLDVRTAQKFWATMSQHLSTVRDVDGQISEPAVHAGALIEECLIGIRTGLKAATTAPPEQVDSALGLRVGTRNLALRLFDIFGDLSDRQFIALGESLRSPYTRNPSPLAREWLRQLRETALNVMIETQWIREDATDEFDHLDKIWGLPSREGRVFPLDLDGERARMVERIRQRKIASE